MYGGRLSGVINCFHEACMVVIRGVMSEASLLNYVDAGRRRVTLRVSREVRREVLGHGLSPFGNLDMITLVGWMCRLYSSLVWRCEEVVQIMQPRFP